MAGTLNQDGSISTRAEVLLAELEQTAKSMEIRSQGLKNDQARLDTFMTNIKWILSVVGAMIIAAFGAVGYLGFESISDLEERVKTSAMTTVDQRILTHASSADSFNSISEKYQELEQDYETYRTWADALSTVSSESELGDRDSRHATTVVSEIAASGATSQEDRLRALALLEAIIRAGINREADPNDLFNAGVDASRMGMYQQASKLAMLASHTRPTVPHRAFELQMEEMFGRRFVYDETENNLVAIDLPAEQVRAEAWQELLATLADAPQLGSAQAYSRASNVTVRNRSAGFYTEMINVIEASLETHPGRVTSYGLQTLSALYLWSEGADWEENYWRAVEASIQ